MGARLTLERAVGPLPHKHAGAALRLSPHQWFGERFWKHVDRSDPFGCWLWTGPHDANGYGTISLDGRKSGAHQVSWLITRGHRRGLYVCHKCDVPACVNPHHLYIGSAHSNHQDAIARGRKFPLEFDEDTGRLISNPEFWAQCLAELLLDEDVRESVEFCTGQTARARDAQISPNVNGINELRYSDFRLNQVESFNGRRREFDESNIQVVGFKSLRDLNPTT